MLARFVIARQHNIDQAYAMWEVRTGLLSSLLTKGMLRLIDSTT